MENKAVEAAALTLKSLLKLKLGNRSGEKIFDALDTWISAKIDYHKQDLSDQIDKSGVYDPDF